MITTNKTPKEGGVIAIQIGNFHDELGNVVLPTSITWTLKDARGNVVNGRGAVPLTPAESVTFAVYGDDLNLADGSGRYVIIDATYDSDLGDDLHLIEQIRFEIEDVK